MAASNIPKPADSGFISGDMFAALHVDYLSDNFFNDLSDAIDKASAEAYREMRDVVLKDPDWAPVADLLYVNVREGDLTVAHHGSGDAEMYINSLEFGDQDRPPTALLRKQARKAADSVSDSIDDFMHEGVSLG